MIVWLRRFLRFIFLRGALLEFWARRKSRLLEQGFLAEIAQVKCGEQKFEDQPKPFPTPLRRILFLGDCMWENEQLIPELEKIAPTSVLDLAPALRASKISDPTIEEAKVTLQVLERYTSQSSENFDLILLYARPSLLSEDIFTMLREKWSCPVFGLNLDDKSHFFPLGIYSRQIDNYRQWVRYFDLNLSSTRAASDWYAQADAPYYFLGMGFHLPEKPVTHLEQIRTMTFVGSRRLERQVLLDQLQQYKVPVVPYGAGWANSDGWVKDAVEIYQSSQLNLGIGFATSNGKITSLKARDYECPGAGGCYLTSYNWELAMEFEVGKEILCYREAEELAEMYFWWIKRPEKCREIALAGQQHCLNEYTWEARFRKLLSENSFAV